MRLSRLAAKRQEGGREGQRALPNEERTEKQHSWEGLWKKQENSTWGIKHFLGLGKALLLSQIIPSSLQCGNVKKAAKMPWKGWKCQRQKGWHCKPPSAVTLKLAQLAI